MQKINLRELYPDIYKTDTFLEVTDEVQAVFLADKRAEARYLLVCSKCLDAIWRHFIAMKDRNTRLLRRNCCNTTR